MKRIVLSHCRSLILLTFAIMVFMMSSCNKQPVFEGYRLIEKKFVKEVNAECYLLEHEKSGARVLKIAADDPNKTFSVGFSTIPVSDAGTPHIMEHSVLNGSKNFPVKSPFDILLKGSLNTFLNAMTADDFTVYPVASMNEKDYFNLMHVYLDAVFNPLIYDDPKIFMQEGWHYELTGKDAPLEYKGVVYNEMKGAFSNPEREMWFQIQRNLFPENGYHYSSGGYPAAIPSLTYEDFLAFHKKNYHPCNSYIFLYGDADLAKELEFIDKEYLSKYEKAEPPAKPNPNPAFSEIKELHSVYPVMEGMLTDHQTYLVMNWVIGSGADPTLTMALDMLADVLVNQESAPVRKAMLEAGIGKDIYATNQAMLQNVFSIVVQNANAADKDKFRAVIDSTLRQVFSAKLDKEILEGAINRMEFRLREGNDAQKGLTYNMRSLAGWIYTDNPFAALEYEKPLATLKTALTSTYLEDLMKKELVDNRYGLVLIHEPKPGLEKELTEKTRNDLAAIKKNLSPAEMDSIIARTTELIAHQQRKDSPEAIASIPMLKLADINSEAMWYEPTEQKVADIPHLHFDDFTNRIVYMNYWFDLRVLTEEQLPYASLLTRLLGKMDAGNYTYEQLDKALNINTGGFGTSVAAFLPQRDDNQLTPRLRVTLKTTVEKLDTAFSLLDVIINHTMLDNKDRLYELLRRHQSQLESNVNQNGFGVAVNRLESYYSRRGVFTEKTRGLDYYWFVTNLTNAFNDNPGKVIDDLKQVYEALFSADNMIAGITCEDGDFKTYAGKFEAFASSLGHKDIALKTWELKPAALNEGILSTSKVQYVLQGYDMNKLDIGWNGKWYVLNQVVSTDWLQNQVRVIGGAYGGFATFSYTGSCYFASYRDPNLSETLNNFKGTVAYLKDFKADSTTMTRYIIGTIANLDNPLTPSEKGETAFRRYFEKTTREDIQRERDEVLATSDADIRSMSDEIDKILEQQVVCVYGNEQKINANKTLFKELVKLQ